jgi:hypothetical protein
VALRLRAGLSVLALLALAGCEFATDPVSIVLEFVPDHTLNADGSCTVRYAAQASGIGEAEWTRVTITRAGSVVEEFVGDRTAAFWGASTIEAGEQQVSAPFTAPNAAASVQIEVAFRITGPERTRQLAPDCVPS